MRLRDPKLQTNPITKRKLRGNGESYIRKATQICQLGCVSLGCVHEFKFTQPYWRSPLAESRHWSRLKRGKVLIRPESAVRQFSEIFVWILSRECQFWKSVRKVTEECPRLEWGNSCAEEEQERLECFISECLLWLHQERKQLPPHLEIAARWESTYRV